MTGRVAVQTDAAPAAIGAYSQAIRAGNLIFTSGQVGADPASGVLAEGVAAQAERALDNLASVLGAAGSGFDRVVKTVIFLTSVDDWSTVNEAYARRMVEPYPARSTVTVRALPKGALVEIEMVALAGDEPGEPERSW
ncbi:MAG: Rid family detoxifying hydrolase [Chloroflexota bacterium]|nr:Rid family detoxifying hydrolase [Chloroflexota bacterium]